MFTLLSVQSCWHDLEMFYKKITSENHALQAIFRMGHYVVYFQWVKNKEIVI